MKILCTHPRDPSLGRLPPIGTWNYLTELEHLLQSAKLNIAIACPFFDQTGVDILSAAYRRGNQGVRWEIYARKNPTSHLRIAAAENDWSLYEYVGTPGRKEKRGFHCKLIVADEVRAILGSANLFYSNLAENLEIGVLLEETSEVRPLIDIIRALKRASRRAV